MKGLLLREFCYIRSYAKTLIIFFALIIGFGLYMKSPEYSCIMFWFYMVSTVISSFAADENNRWDQYALCTRVSKKEMVMEKYLFLLLAALAEFLLSLIMTGGINLIVKRPYPLFWFCLGAVLFILLLMEIVLPLVYLLGASKGRYALMLVYAVPALAFVSYISNYKIRMEQILNVLNKFQLIFFGIVVCGFLLSCYISIQIYSRKEW